MYTCVPSAVLNLSAAGKVRILRMLENSNVVGVHEFFDQSPDYFYVVLKRMEGGVVLDRIVTKVETLEMRVFANFASRRVQQTAVQKYVRSSMIINSTYLR